MRDGRVIGGGAVSQYKNRRVRQSWDRVPCLFFTFFPPSPLVLYGTLFSLHTTHYIPPPLSSFPHSLQSPIALPPNFPLTGLFLCIFHPPPDESIVVTTITFLGGKKEQRLPSGITKKPQVR